MPTMKYAIAAALMTLIAAPVVHAETTAPATARFTVDTSIEALAADPAAKTALDANFPGITAHPMYDQFKSMSLKALQPMAADKISDEALAKLSADLAAIK
jgi:hypothetical protein